MKIMFDAAKEDGISLMIGAGHRSYNYQKNLYNNYVAGWGGGSQPLFRQARTERASDRPGRGFIRTNGNYLKGASRIPTRGVWLKENAWKYGFILRYRKARKKLQAISLSRGITAISAQKKAQKIYESGLTVEEYYNLLD